MSRALLVGLLLALACDGTISGVGDDPINPIDPINPGRTVSSGPAVGRRLIHEEIANSVEVVFGVELDLQELGLPRDNRIPGAFRNSAPELLLSPARVRAYDAIAEAVVQEMDFSAFMASHAACTDAANGDCRTGFIESAGLAVHRRPLPAEEVALYGGLFDVALEEGEGFEAGARLVLRAMIQSPRFLYRFEFQTPEGDASTRTVDPYELATRLSFLVWASAPDEELLALAEAGTLADQVEPQVRRMLDDPRAQRAFRQYIEQWLFLDAIPDSFPLGADMKEETYRLFEWLVWEQDGDLMEAFTSTRAELSGPLAEHYDLSATSSGFELYDLAGTGRVGFLTHGSVMTGRTINPSSSMIDRGLFVLNDIFCDSVPEPEGDELRAAIEEEAVPETSGLSQRERFARQSENPLCATCHAKFDPLGLAFERFGSAGQYQLEDEFGNALTGEGHLTLGDVNVRYESAEEFAAALSTSETVARCLVQKTVQYAYGRRIRDADRSLIDDMHERFEAGEGSYRELVVSIATHPEFGLVEVAE